MAITQQFARVSIEELEKCRNDKQALDDVISFRLHESNYLDLNWANSGLQILFEKSKQTLESQKLLDLALNSDKIVNSEWEAAPLNDYYVYSPITYVDPEEVQRIAGQFGQVDVNSVMSCFPESLQEANSLVKLDFTIHPRTFYSEYLQQLIYFYVKAARFNAAIITWWD